MKIVCIRKISATVLGLIGSLLLSSSGHTSAVRAQSNDQSPNVIRLLEQVQNVTFVDAPPAGPSQGDRVVFTSNLFDESGTQIGIDDADCVIVRIDLSAPLPTQQVFQCTITVQLGDGEITFQGLARGTENFFAITGGTGAYLKARGQAFAKDLVPLQVADVTITIFP